MGSMKFVVTAFLLLASIVAASTEAAMSCDTATDSMIPCIYVAPPGETIRDACCNGIRIMNEKGSTPSKRQLICSCMKPTLVISQKLSLEFLKPLATYPARCGVNLFFRLEPSVDCNSLN